MFGYILLSVDINETKGQLFELGMHMLLKTLIKP